MAADPTEIIGLTNFALWHIAFATLALALIGLVIILIGGVKNA